jgi:hypothetical protein
VAGLKGAFFDTSVLIAGMMKNTASSRRPPCSSCGRKSSRASQCTTFQRSYERSSWSPL